MKKFALILCIVCMALLSACAIAPGTDGGVDVGAVQKEATATAVPAHSAGDETEVGTDIRELTVLYTNDEHGWLAGLEDGRGAAELMGLLVAAEGFDPDGPFLLLSGGDMWTGPAISTWFQGQSTLEVMNEMGYRAAAVGNHEFDFGLETLTELAAAAEFPFLSANIRYQDNGTTPVDLGIESYSIVTVNDLRVGIIGLTTTSTPRTTNPVNVSEFEFWDYETALRDILPLVEGEGVDLILVPGHICQDEAISLAEKVADLPIDMIGGGHCNELFAEEVAGITVLEGGTAFGSYARATFAYDRRADELVGVTMAVNVNVGGAADPTIAAIVDGWQQATDEVLNQVIGYSEKGIARRSPEMQALITESWLVAFPTADVAVTNLGGMRADLPSGEITLADILTVMPFENVIVEVLITGEQLDTLLGYNSATFAGVYRESFRWYLNSSESEIEEDALYAVLVSDFMYAGGDEYRRLAQWDPNGYDTSVSWRQPVIDWIEAQDSSPDNPLDKAIEDLLP